MYQSYVSKLAGFQCFDTVEQNRTLWNTNRTLLFKKFFQLFFAKAMFHYSKEDNQLFESTISYCCSF